MKKSTIALIVAAVVCLGLSAFSAKASVGYLKFKITDTANQNEVV